MLAFISEGQNESLWMLVAPCLIKGDMQKAPQFLEQCTSKNFIHNVTQHHIFGINFSFFLTLCQISCVPLEFLCILNLIIEIPQEPLKFCAGSWIGRLCVFSLKHHLPFSNLLLITHRSRWVKFDDICNQQHNTPKEVEEYDFVIHCWACEGSVKQLNRN